MNEWAEREGKEHDRKIIDLMLAHVPTGKVEGAYNRAAYMPRRRELATIWSDMLSDGLSDPTILIERPSKVIGEHSRRRLPDPVETDFRRSEEHTSELQSLMRISYAVFCLKKKTNTD